MEGHALAAEACADEALLGFLSHDLRTPLGPLALAISSIAEDANAPPDVRDLARFADAQARRMGRLIDAVLWASRGARGGEEVAPLADAVRDAADLVGAIGVRCLVTPGEGSAACPPTLLRDAVALLLEVAAGDEARVSAVVEGDAGGSCVRFTGAGTPRAAAEALSASLSTWRAVSIAGARAVVRASGGKLSIGRDAIVARFPLEAA